MVYFCPSQLPDTGTEVGSHPERERDGCWRRRERERGREGGIAKKTGRGVIEKIARRNPERKKTNGVHTLYRSHPIHLFIDHL